MGFPFSRILNQALSLVRTNKFLWSLGLFLVWGNVFFGMSLISKQEPNKELSYEPNMAGADAWLVTHEAWAAFFGLVILIVIGILIWLYLRSRAGIILSIKSLLEKKPQTFKESFKQSKFFVGKVFHVWLGLLALLVVCSVIVATPIAYLISVDLTGRALTLGILAVIIFAPVVVIVGLINILSVLYIVFYKMEVINSIRASFDLITKHWINLIIFGIIHFCVTLAGFFGSLFASAFVFAPFVFLAQMSYYVGGYSMNPLAIGTGFILAMILFFWLQSIIASFQHTSWILVFLELVRPTKIEEELEVVVAPEVV